MLDNKFKPQAALFMSRRKMNQIGISHDFKSAQNNAMLPNSQGLFDMIGAQTAYANNTPWAETQMGYGRNTYGTAGKPKSRAQTSYGTPNMRQRYGSQAINAGVNLIN